MSKTHHLEDIILPRHDHQEQGVPGLLDHLDDLGVRPPRHRLPVDTDEPVADVEASEHSRTTILDRLDEDPDKHEMFWVRYESLTCPWVPGSEGRRPRCPPAQNSQVSQ